MKSRLTFLVLSFFLSVFYRSADADTETERLEKELKAYKYSCFAVCLHGTARFFNPSDYLESIFTHDEDLDTAFRQLETQCAEKARRVGSQWHELDNVYHRRLPGLEVNTNQNCHRNRP